ncbi:MAG TPA: DUF4168 domain-containing protein [Candidatus Binatia bacterium]|jgi:hypothetical protein|nr:DUF4168 domain-containing protein [Candidatus Binatia bacterium]
MKKIISWRVMLAALVGLLSLPFALAHAQQAPAQQGSGQPAKVSDKELRAFAKAYVEFHKIRERYEPAMSKAKDSAEKEKIQQEGNLKVKEAVEKQGFTVESYNRIFAAVNGNEELRKKALKLINEERKKS